jgi:putative hydroxymethylpyrimidine transport system substrate-binding protein
LKRFTLLPLALFVAMAVAACGTKSEDVNPVRDPLSVAMDWYPNPDHAGFLVAQDQGYFEDAGLDVSLDSPSGPSLPIKLVAAGKADRPSHTNRRCCWPANRVSTWSRSRPWSGSHSPR